MLQKVMVLGLVPGTDYELSFEAIILLILALYFGYKSVILYALYHYKAVSVYRSYKARRLLRNNGLQ